MKTYAFSGWIENLGVVPLFSFACFLLAPAFFLFNFLLILVCVVFEDIVISLSFFNNIKFRVVFLSLFVLLVKALFPSNTLLAATKQESDNIFIAKGEQIELSIENLESYSIGNNEIIALKLMRNQKKILVKGKMIGFSDLILNQGTKKNYHIYVTSKQEQLRKMEIAHSIAQAGLKLKATEKLLYIEGIVKDLESYLILKKLQETDQNYIQLNVELANNFKNELIAKLYQDFYSNGGLFIDCHVTGININCFYQSDTSIDVFKKHYLIKYKIELLPSLEKLKNQNFEIHCIIIAKETSAAQNSHSGFNKIQFDLQSVIDNGHSKLQTDQFLYQDHNTEIRVLASPTVTTLIGEPFMVELGTQIPYQATRDQTTFTEWNFAGLKLSGLLSIKDGFIRMKYKSELTQGSQEGISGPQNKATVYMPLEKSIQVLSIKARDVLKMQAGVPWLRKVPILNFFFSENSLKDSQKEISIYLKLKKKEI